MADSPSSPATMDPSIKQPESDHPNRKPDPPSTAIPPPEQQQQQQQPSVINPNQNQTPAPASLPPPPPVQAYAPPTQPISYRPVPIPTAVQFSPYHNYQNPGVQPPGVGGVSATMAPPLMQYPVAPGQVPNPALRPYAPLPNGYGAIPAPAPGRALLRLRGIGGEIQSANWLDKGTWMTGCFLLLSYSVMNEYTVKKVGRLQILHKRITSTTPFFGLPRYPAPYPAMVRPAFPPRPPVPFGVLPQLVRPPVPGTPGVRPIMPPVVRPAEKPQTKVYVGKIAPTADSDFVLSILKVCGTVKSWKRAQVPSNGTAKGFGFCEFESAEGVLRALRLINKFNIDGQELMLNVDQATREYLERYVEKKAENAKKLKETQDAGTGKVDESVQSVDKNEPTNPPEAVKDNETRNKENLDPTIFGIVTDEDRAADQEALEKLTSMIEERLKTNPLPPPPPQTTADGSGISNSELPTKTRDGDSDVDMIRNDIAEDKLDDETTSDTKATSDHDRPETSSPDRSRVHDRRSRDKERDLKREKERELDKYEREAERERVRKEREQRKKIDEAEREYERCLKDWEYREKEREKERQYEKEKEKERERKRKKEILYDEDEDEDDSRKRWHRNVLEEKRRKRMWEKEEDLADRVREVEEIAEAKSRAEEEQLQRQQRDALKLLSNNAPNSSEKTVLAEESAAESKDMAVEHDYYGDSICENHTAGDVPLQNGTGDESTNVSIAISDMRQSGNAPARKLGFGLVGSGKRTAVPSVFHEEDDDDVDKEKKMRPLVPIDYSTEDLQADQPVVSAANPPNLAAAAEFAKHISNVYIKEDKPDAVRERSRRSHDRSSQREKDRSAEDNNRTRDQHKEKILNRDRDREHGLDMVKTPDNKKLLDAKQLIDMIPKTKEDLFSYEINWAVYDKHELHERMRPWISKKITEFLGEEETTLTDYIVSSTREHVKASQMLELLQTILDDEAEMFVLKMWRMLIFEIKRVETGIALRSKS